MSDCHSIQGGKDSSVMRRIFFFSLGRTWDFPDMRDGNSGILYYAVTLHTNALHSPFLWSATAYKVVRTPLI